MVHLIATEKWEDGDMLSEMTTYQVDVVTVGVRKEKFLLNVSIQSSWDVLRA